MSVRFSTNGDGKWYKTTYKNQCEHEVFLINQQCQGEEGHAGKHWAYGADGSLHRDHNEAEPCDGIAAEITPPGHERWISPVDMDQHHYLNSCETQEVVDAELIKRLEAGELEDEESMDRPFDPTKESPELVAEINSAMERYHGQASRTEDGNQDVEERESAVQ